MKIIESDSKIEKTVIITEVEEADFKGLTKKRFSFDWKKKMHGAKFYKLRIKYEDDILGVMAIVDIPEEKRIEIKLLACAIENVGKNKYYEGITGCLIAYACRIANKQYAEMACVSLIPKTILKEHYIRKYKMADAGWQLFLEGKRLNDIILKYSA